MIKIAVCDDEKIFVDHVMNFLEKIKKNISSDIIFKSYTSAFELLNNIEQFNLLFLDVEMPEMNGFDVAKEIRQRDVDCEIVFLTSSKELGYKGYEVRAKNYLIKPIKYNSLLDIISSEIEDTNKKKTDMVIFTIDGSKLKSVNISDIVFVEAKGRKCLVKCAQGEFDINERLKDVKEKLEKYTVLSPHRSYLINCWKINDYNISEVIMNDGCIIPMSRLKYKSFREDYYRFLNGMKLWNCGNS